MEEGHVGVYPGGVRRLAGQGPTARTSSVSASVPRTRIDARRTRRAGCARSRIPASLRAGGIDVAGRVRRRARRCRARRSANASTGRIYARGACVVPRSSLERQGLAPDRRVRLPRREQARPVDRHRARRPTRRRRIPDRARARRLERAATLARRCSVRDGVAPGVGGVGQGDVERALAIRRSPRLRRSRRRHTGRARALTAPRRRAPGRRAQTTRDAGSAKHASQRAARSAHVEPALAARSPSRPARPRARRRSVVHAVDHASAHERARPARAPRGRRSSRRRRHAAVEAVHDRRPLRAAELGAGSRRARRSSSPAASRGRGRAVVAARRSRPSTPTTGVGWMSSPLDAL